MLAYYNDNEKFVCAWLLNLIAAKLITPGDVDERSITEVSPDDLKGYDRVHFFAGIGGWDYALNLAGWDDAPVWTGSCPCQPLSIAGQRKGHADERHIWPAFYRLIAECKPATVFGEQVASALGREWLAGVRADLEALGYAVGAADLCAAGVSAPHIRQRLYWMADTNQGQCRRLANGEGRERDRQAAGRIEGYGIAQSSGEFGRIGNADEQRSQGRRERSDEHADQQSAWSASKLIQCLDGKERRIPLEPALFPLASRFPNRVGILRGAGNSICPPLAAELVRAAMECMP